MTENVFLVMFDAKVKTIAQRRNYRRFIKDLKGYGYQMLQKSVYYKYVDSYEKIKKEERRLNLIVKPTIELRALVLSYLVFAKMINVNCDPVVFWEREDIICV